MATLFDPDPENLQKCQPEKGPKAVAAMASIKEKLGPEELVIPFALHGDGVPVQGTIRQEGLDFFTVNLPGAHDAKLKSPVPFTLLQSCFHWDNETKETILHILMWSMTCLKNCKFPTTRHGGTAWRKSDKERLRQQEKPCQQKASWWKWEGVGIGSTAGTTYPLTTPRVACVGFALQHSRIFEPALPMTEVLD